MVRARVYSRRPHLWRRSEGGTFYILWTEGRSTRKRSTGTRKRVLAEAALDEFLKRLDEPQAAAKPVTMQAAIAEWLTDRSRPRSGLSPATLVAYRSWAKEFTGAFPEGLAAKDVTPAMLRRYLDRQEDAGDLPTTHKKKLGGLSMVFEFLLREGHLLRNPCKAIRMTAEPKRHPAMTSEEYQTLRGALSADLEHAEDPQARRDAQELLDLADVLWNSGLRYVESQRLVWADVDLELGQWVIRSPKNKGGVQTLPIHPSVLPILRRRQLLGDPGPFTGYWKVQRSWNAFKARHPAFKGWSWHRMRHAFVTRLRRAGRDAAAMALARHRTPAMSAHYTHMDMTDLRSDLEKV